MDCYHNTIQTQTFDEVNRTINMYHILDSEVTTRIWDDLGDMVWDRVSDQINTPIYIAVRLRTQEEFEKRNR